MSAWLLLFFLSAVLSAITVVAEEPPGNLVFEREGDQEATGAFPPSIFPHWVHRVRYRCDACHNSLFEMKAGATVVSMATIKSGQHCGACHNGSLAFDDSFENCARCHRPSVE